jgi:low temperature requirement protein LtrA
VTPPSPFRHLRARGEAGTQRITTVEVFFDLVYVFAITQLSHLVLADPSIGGLASAAFLLVVVWWAWIYTTWMANWFDPSSRAVTAVLGAVMLASLLMAAAIPGALGDHGVLFAASYVALQVGRNAAAVALLARDHRLRNVFERLLAWSVVSGALWLGGAILAPDQRLLLWIPALVLDLAAPAAGYWLPGRGRAVTADYDIEGHHFAERCQLFVIIALGESIVVTGATAANHGLTFPVVICLVLAFLETVALWWLYFGGPTEDAHAAVTGGANPGRLARDAYTYVHLLIIAGIIATAAGDNLLIANPDEPLHGVGLAIVLGGPALFLLGGRGLTTEGRPGGMVFDLGLGHPHHLARRQVQAVKPAAARIYAVVAPALVALAEVEELAGSVAVAVEIDLEGRLLGRGQRASKMAGAMQHVVEPRRQFRVVCDLGDDLGAHITRVRHAQS